MATPLSSHVTLLMAEGATPTIFTFTLHCRPACDSCTQQWLPSAIAAVAQASKRRRCCASCGPSMATLPGRSTYRRSTCTLPVISNHVPPRPWKKGRMRREPYKQLNMEKAMPPSFSTLRTVGRDQKLRSYVRQPGLLSKQPCTTGSAE